jgi:hypothetical protein
MDVTSTQRTGSAGVWRQFTLDKKELNLILLDVVQDWVVGATSIYPCMENMKEVLLALIMICHLSLYFATFSVSKSRSWTPSIMYVRLLYDSDWWMKQVRTSSPSDRRDGDNASSSLSTHWDFQTASVYWIIIVSRRKKTSVAIDWAKRFSCPYPHLRSRHNLVWTMPIFILFFLEIGHNCLVVSDGCKMGNKGLLTDFKVLYIGTKGMIRIDFVCRRKMLSSSLLGNDANVYVYCYSLSTGSTSEIIMYNFQTWTAFVLNGSILC